MRIWLASFVLALSGTASTAHAATVVIMVDSATLERRTIVIPTRGADRVLLCMAPPAVSGCRNLKPAR
jgi:hypothetical protein